MDIDLENAGAAEDRRFEALADEGRRRIVSVLCGAEAPLSLTELAIELVEAGDDPAGVESDPVERHRIELYHRHVPKLAEAGLVEFDADRRKVALTAEFDEADGTVELLPA